MTNHKGISLIEIMIGITLGIMLSIAVIGIYLAQKNTYKTNVSQATIQSSENAISALVIPTIRAAGFCGCSSTNQAISNLNPGGPPPLGTLNTLPTMIMGYTIMTGNPITISQDNAINNGNASHWIPSLDPSLVGQVEGTSDVLVVLGAAPFSQPSGVT